MTPDEIALAISNLAAYRDAEAQGRASRSASKAFSWAPRTSRKPDKSLARVALIARAKCGSVNDAFSVARTDAAGGSKGSRPDRAHRRAASRR